jgi:hypothetical protein
MANELELARFKQEWRDIRALPEASRWQLERDKSVPLGLFAVMHPASKPTELFQARIRWTNYFGPPSLKFINITSGADTDPAAWPRCYGFRPGALDTCLPWTAEGHALHREWQGSATHSFPEVELPMQYVLLRIQHSLDGSYEGRGPT